MPQVVPINSLAEFNEILNSGKVFIVDFWATWCGPCRSISPIFEKIAAKVAGDIEFYKVDVDAVPDVSQECGIRAMPTFIAFKNGVKIGELVGANAQRLESLVATSLQSA